MLKQSAQLLMFLDTQNIRTLIISEIYRFL